MMIQAPSSAYPNGQGPMPLPTEEELARGPVQSDRMIDSWNYGIHGHTLALYHEAKRIIDAAGQDWDTDSIRTMMRYLEQHPHIRAHLDQQHE